MMINKRYGALALALAFLLGTTLPLNAADKDKPASHPLAGLPLRSIGPALPSGRISDFAFHPDRKQEFYVAVSAGNLWKTENNGISWRPLFDDQPSYATGVVELAPSDPKIVWLGTGENNAQRSVSYGDGVYKSIDGGSSWEQMGLADSGHISQIWIHPQDANHVLVAAQGPLWSEGGDRGLYKTLDGGQSWELILEIDPHTGVNEFVVDPRNFDNIVASSYQRRRHVWVLINGGPGSAIHKTSDGGKSWQKISAGLPKDNMGRIGLAGAASAPDMIYAIIEGSKEEQGVYRSTDFGNNWEKRSSRMTSSPQYYNEIVVDPKNPQRLYSMDTFTHISEDGGKTFSKLSNEWRHVDDHALWIDPDDTAHLFIGGDGGIYESWDRGQTWRFLRNLPVTQFYRIQPDNASPFYNVCGGTQDNNSLCGPSRTSVVHGITNSDWNIILGGDGYKPQFDPDDPNIIYTQFQYGNLFRYDRRTQERVTITPHPQSGEPGYKWNWNTPILISPHDGHRLYYAAEYLFRSDDRGDSWRKVSPDLTRQINRNSLEVMGRVWGVDAVAKNDSTSRWGSAIGLSESPLVEGLIYVGTDDGVINVTEDDGANWTRTETFRGVPELTLVEDVEASRHNADVVYAVFDNHKRGDNKPYVMKSSNRGRSWKSIAGDLPLRGSVHTIAEDHVDPKLLFVGTEFGLFFTQDGGGSWHQLKNNFPTNAVRDLEIQRRENDLVVGTFGRGIYILDNYTALRSKAADIADAQLFEVRDPWLYIVGDLWHDKPKGRQGEAFFNSPNPPYGAVFTYYLKDAIETQAEKRLSAETDAASSNADNPYPDWDLIREQDQEVAPQLFIMVRDNDGKLVRQVSGETKQGLHRSAWDLRLPPPDPVRPANYEKPYWGKSPAGPKVIPGTYTARLAIMRDGVLSEFGESQSFNVKALDNSPEITSDRRALQSFLLRAKGLQRAVQGTVQVLKELDNRVTMLRGALVQENMGSDADRAVLQDIYKRLQALQISVNGDSALSKRNTSVPLSIASRASSIYTPAVFAQAPIGSMLRDSYAIAAKEFAVALAELQALDSDLSTLEDELEMKGAPWTSGRIPQWSDSPR
ncbi:MAG: glycosyl hydrolase [Halieaceae bacterium]